jgi:hypothetical protein
VALVSAPGWSHAYEGQDWIARMELDLATLAGTLRPRGAPQDLGDNEGAPSNPAPLGAQ